MPAGTKYSALRGIVGLWCFHFWVQKAQRRGDKQGQEKKKKSYELGKAREIPRITAYQQKQRSKDHCKKKKKQPVSSKELLNWAFLPSITGWIPNTVFIIHWWRRQTFEMLRFRLPPFLSLSSGRHPVMSNCVSTRDHSGDGSLINCSAQQMTTF